VDAASRKKKRLIVAAGAVLAAAVTALGVLQLVPAGGDDGGAGTEPGDTTRTEATAVQVANRFLDAFAAGDAAGAGALTDAAAAATAQLTAVWQALAPTSVVADRTAIVAPAPGATTVAEPFTLTWEFGPGRGWTYESTLALAEGRDGWRVRWQPSLVHPRLTAGHTLALRTRTGQPAVLDRDGAPLVTWSDAGSTPADPAVAPLLVPGMRRVADGRGSTGGWHVALADAAGTEVEVLHGTRSVPLTSTLSRPVQRAAQAAVDAQPLPTMLVAVQPSTGDLLAVAQNSAAGAQPVALNGLYPPGSAFKVATAAAVIEAGAADVDTVLPCPAAVTVGQRTVRNAGFELGEVPLRTAFAQSCNTTFASAAATLPPDALVRSADQLGLGADFAIPGLVTETGDVRAAGNTAEQVENSIGQGTVRTSCFGLALMTATVAAGKALTPRLWRDLDTVVTAGYRAPSPAVLGSLRTMMRAVVTSGRATALAGHGTVSGKTGTAQVGDGTRAHGWFVGYRDDLAFATLVLDASTSTTAVTTTGEFLTRLGR
jgi:hypothetical protein